MNIYEKLSNVQLELKVPKSQFNAFGKYNYRSCEDILEALKPVLRKYGLSIFTNDDIVHVEGSGRNYVKTKITLINIEKPDEKIETVAFAREDEVKKGMDGSQITGASSSYARKYALNGLFAIDDTKDNDNFGGFEEFEEFGHDEKLVLAEVIAKKISKKDLEDFLKEKKIKLLTNANYFDLKSLHDKLALSKPKTEEEEKQEEDRNEIIQKIKGKFDESRINRMFEHFGVKSFEGMTMEQLKKAYEIASKQGGK